MSIFQAAQKNKQSNNKTQQRNINSEHFRYTQRTKCFKERSLVMLRNRVCALRVLYMQYVAPPSSPNIQFLVMYCWCVGLHRGLKMVKLVLLKIIISYPLAGLFEYLFMFWQHRPSRPYDSKQSTKGYERIIREILRRSGYFNFATFLYFWSLLVDTTSQWQCAEGIERRPSRPLDIRRVVV